MASTLPEPDRWIGWRVPPEAEIGVYSRPPEPASAGAAANRDTTAILVCHGMGQQVRWETLAQFIHALGVTPAKTNPVDTRIIRFTDDEGGFSVGRAELTLTHDGMSRRVHVYEAYWAPITDGNVTLRDVVGFLVQAGWNGLLLAREPFHRFLFNRWVAFRKRGGWLVFQFSIALAVVLSLISMNVVVVGVSGALFLSDGSGPFSNRLILSWLTVDLAVFTGIVLGWSWVNARVAARRARIRTTDNTYAVSRWVQWLLMAGFWGLVVAIIAVGVTMAVHTIVYRDVEAPPISRALGLLFAAVWGLAYAVNRSIRRFLVQYVGDVAAYLSGYRVSKFDEIRDRIQAIVARIAGALFTQGGYADYVIVGHSLGSVVAYDTLNQLTLSYAGNAKPNVHERTSLVTFGSPLDKTAFVFRTQQSRRSDVREALAAAAQPLIGAPPTGARKWINIHSPNDIISGALDYYGAQVDNRPDPQADIPLIAHVQFWSNPTLAAAIKECVFRAAPAPRVPARAV